MTLNHGPDDSLRPFAVDLSNEGEARLTRFEQAWRIGPSPPDLRLHLEPMAACSERERWSLLWELVAVDLEYRWRGNSQPAKQPLASPNANREPVADALGGQPRLEDYRLALGGLLPEWDWPLGLIAEEYRVRRLWGDRPSSAHYLARFPAAPAALLRALQQVDRELLAESATPAPERRQPISPGALVDPMAPLPYGDFVLERHLGTGGVGKVYRARQLSLGRPVAIKALRKDRQANPQAVARFLQEAKLLARLRHPGIVGIHGLGRFPGGGYFMALELIEGESLGRRMQREPLPALEALCIALRVADAVESAHQQGIIHCDLSPGNILLDGAVGVFVTDFGFAQLLAPSEDSAFAAGGTLPFMAPEQLDPAIGPLCPATDVYGLGAVLRTMLQPGERRPDLLAICQQATHPDPTQRFATAAELATALRTSQST